MEYPPEWGVNGGIMTATIETVVAENSETEERDTLTFWAVLLSSAIVPLPIVVGAGLEAIFDSLNPANVDVRQPLAYLRELLGYGFGLLALLLLAITVVCALLYKQRGPRALVLPITIVVTQVVLGLSILYLNGVVEGIEAGYVAGQ